MQPLLVAKLAGPFDFIYKTLWPVPRIEPRVACSNDKCLWSGQFGWSVILPPPIWV